MPETTNYEIQTVWLDFTNSVRLLLIPLPDDRPLDQYLAFRDSVMALVQTPEFLNELQQAWDMYSPSFPAPLSEVRWALPMELKAFPLAVEVVKATETGSSEFKGLAGKWLGRASTVTGSVKDLVDTLPPYAKGAITLFKELTDLFKGKD